MGYKSRTDYIQEARVLYNMEIFPGGRVTLKEDILRVNARLIPTTGKPQRSYDLHYRAISICVSRTVQTVVYWNKNLAGIFNQKKLCTIGYRGQLTVDYFPLGDISLP